MAVVSRNGIPPAASHPISPSMLARHEVEAVIRKAGEEMSFLSFKIGTTIPSSHYLGLPTSVQRAATLINKSAEDYGFGEAKVQACVVKGQKFYVVTGLLDDMANQLTLFGGDGRRLGHLLEGPDMNSLKWKP